MSAAGGPLRGSGETRKEAASPPLISQRAAQATGPLLRPPGCCASRCARQPWRAALDPGDLGGPWRQEERSGPGPAPARRTARGNPAVAGVRGIPGRQGTRLDWCSIIRRSGEITQIQVRAPGPVTSSQQSHLAKLGHTKPGVHETRDAPAAVVGPPAKATDHESSPPSISRLSEAAPPAGATAARPESGAAAAKPHHRRSARNRRSARRRARNGVTALVAASAQVPPT